MMLTSKPARQRWEVPRAERQEAFTKNPGSERGNPGHPVDQGGRKGSEGREARVTMARVWTVAKPGRP